MRLLDILVSSFLYIHHATSVFIDHAVQGTVGKQASEPRDTEALKLSKDIELDDLIGAKQPHSVLRLTPPRSCKVAEIKEFGDKTWGL